jgi:uncharacterized membrane protein YoaK (UPF0700 family)
VSFSLGALIGGRLLRRRSCRSGGSALPSNWFIILAATALTWVSEPDAHNLAGHVVVAMLALAMGIQNAMVRVHACRTSRPMSYCDLHRNRGGAG